MAKERITEEKVEEGLTKAIFGSKVRPDVFEALLKGEISINKLSKQLNVSVATLLTSIAPLLLYRVVDVSLGGSDKSVALGRGIPTNQKTKDLVNELARNVMRTKETIRKLSLEIVESETHPRASPH
jgi:hypothetical protein